MYSPVGMNDDAPAPGYTQYSEGVEGHRNGSAWIPAECDVSIRPGWFYHVSEDAAVKVPIALMKLYLKSVGRNAALLLNVPLDRRGLVSSGDSVALMGFRRMRDECYQGSFVVELQQAPGVDSLWLSTAADTAGFNGLELSEDIRRGQRVAAFRVEAWVHGKWTTITSGTTIGRKRIMLVPTTMASQLRVRIERSIGVPHLQPVRLLRIPKDLNLELLTEP
jgi:alpha-L-fucosidase